jgi:hypothetical protein
VKPDSFGGLIGPGAAHVRGNEPLQAIIRLLAEDIVAEHGMIEAKPASLTTTLIHEAGHCVVGVAAGLPPLYCWVKHHRTHGFLGETHHRDGEDLNLIADPERAVRHAVFGIAGWAAEEAFDRENLCPCSSIDERANFILIMGNLARIQGRDVQKTLDTTFDAVAACVRANEASVRRVAEALKRSPPLQREDCLRGEKLIKTIGPVVPLKRDLDAAAYNSALQGPGKECQRSVHRHGRSEAHRRFRCSSQ